MLKPDIFRERSISGIADSDLSDADVEVLGQAMASYLIRYSGRVICVGRDDRPSSPRVHAALLKGLQAAGSRVLDVGIVPTPLLYYSSVHFTADAAIMITGGSESPEYNGFKLVCGAARLYGHALADIQKVIQLADFENGEGTYKQVDSTAPYIDELTSQFRFANTLKFALEVGTETTRSLFQRLLKSMHASVTRKHDAAVTISLTADAEHLQPFDEKGHAIPPSSLLLLFGREILQRKPESVLLYDEQFPPEISTQLIEMGGKPVPVNSAELSIQSKIKEERAELSVQASGQIVFADRFYGFEDAIYAAFRLLEIISRLESPLSAELARLPQARQHPR